MVDFKKQEKTNVTASAEKSMEYTVSEQIFFHEDVNGTIWLAQKGGPFGYYDEKTQKHNPLLLKSDRESYGKLVSIVKNTVDSKRTSGLLGGAIYIICNLNTTALCLPMSIPIQRYALCWQIRKAEYGHEPTMEYWPFTTATTN